LNHSLENAQILHDFQLQQELDAAHRFINEAGDSAEDPYKLDWHEDDRLQLEARDETEDTLLRFKEKQGNVINLEELGAIGKRFTGLESSKSGRSIVPSKRLRG